MTVQNGWTTFEPQGPNGKFQKYKSQLVIIVSQSVKKNSKAAIYLTEAVMKKLEQPKFIQVLTRGQNIGFMKSETKDSAYTVMRTKSEKENTEGNAFLSLHALSKSFDLAPGVYDAHWENGVTVFDTRSKPSKL